MIYSFFTVQKYIHPKIWTIDSIVFLLYIFQDFTDHPYKSIIIITCTLSNSPHAILRLLYINLQIFTFFKVLSYMAL